MNLLKIFEKSGKSYFIKIDDMDKAKRMEIGTVATWADGKQYRKVSDSNWEEVKGGTSHKHDTASGGAKATDADDVSTPKKLHEKFMDAVAKMSKEHREFFRNGKMDFEKREYKSADGKFTLKYQDGKVHMVNPMKKAKMTKEEKISHVMREFDAGKLKSSDGKKVTDKKQALAIAYSESEDYMIEDKELEKAESKGPHKYIKRVPKKTGKGVNYFYTKAEYEQYKKTGQLPGEKKGGGIWAGIMSFFGFKSKDQAEKKLKDIHQKSFSDVAYKTFEDHVNEYVTNKAKWDKKFSEKKDVITRDKKTGEVKRKKAESVEGKEKEKSRFDTALMKRIAGVLGGGAGEVEKKQEYAKLEVKNEDDIVKEEMESLKKQIKYSEDQIKNANEEWVKKEYQATIDKNKKRLNDLEMGQEILNHKEKKESGKITVNKLMNLDGEIMDKLGAESGQDIRHNESNAKQYADHVFKTLDDMGVKELPQSVFDKLEDRNYHVLNFVLSLGGYFGKEMQEREIAYNKEQLEKESYYSFPFSAVESKLPKESAPEPEKAEGISKELTDLYSKRASDRFVLNALLKQGSAGKGEVEKVKNRLYDIEEKIKEEEKKLEKKPESKKEEIKNIAKPDFSKPKNKKEFLLNLIEKSGVNNAVELKALSDDYDNIVKERGNEIKAISFLTDILSSRTKESFPDIYEKVNNFETMPEPEKTPGDSDYSKWLQGNDEAKAEIKHIIEQSNDIKDAAAKKKFIKKEKHEFDTKWSKKYADRDKPGKTPLKESADKLKEAVETEPKNMYQFADQKIKEIDGQIKAIKEKLSRLESVKKDQPMIYMASKNDWQNEIEHLEDKKKWYSGGRGTDKIKSEYYAIASGKEKLSYEDMKEYPDLAAEQMKKETGINFYDNEDTKDIRAKYHDKSIKVQVIPKGYYLMIDGNPVRQEDSYDSIVFQTPSEIKKYLDDKHSKEIKNKKEYDDGMASQRWEPIKIDKNNVKIFNHGSKQFDKIEPKKVKDAFNVWGENVIVVKIGDAYRVIESKTGVSLAMSGTSIENAIELAKNNLHKYGKEKFKEAIQNNMSKDMKKATQLLIEGLRKAKELPVGSVSPDGKMRKQASGEWVPVGKGGGKKPGKDDEKPKKGNEKPEQKGGEKKEGGKREIIKTALKKVADILAEALKGKDVAHPTGEAASETGRELKEKDKEAQYKKEMQKQQAQEKKK